MEYLSKALETPDGKEAPAPASNKKTSKGVPHVGWSEERLLSLLRTAASFHHATTRFNGKNLTHGKKGSAMKSIRSALEQDPVLWPRVPTDVTLDTWLDDAVSQYLKVRSSCMIHA